MELCCDKFRDSLDLGEEVKHDDGCPMAARDKKDGKLEGVYTLIRHPESRNDPGMEKAVGFVEVMNPYVVSKIEERGGYVFEDKEDAIHASQNEGYPPFHQGSDPAAPGTFLEDLIVTNPKTKEHEAVYVLGWTHPDVKAGLAKMLGKEKTKIDELIEVCQAEVPATKDSFLGALKQMEKKKTAKISGDEVQLLA